MGQICTGRCYYVIRLSCYMFARRNNFVLKWKIFRPSCPDLLWFDKLFMIELYLFCVGNVSSIRSLKADILLLDESTSVSDQPYDCPLKAIPSTCSAWIFLFRSRILFKVFRFTVFILLTCRLVIDWTFILTLIGSLSSYVISLFVRQAIFGLLL